MVEPVAVRDELVEFAYAMERVLRGHDSKKGNSWKTCDEGFLRDKLRKEYNEFIGSHRTPELLDMANICMMLWHRGLK